METILIRPELLELVRDGKKHSTCRLGRRNYPLGMTKLQSNASEDYSYIDITEMEYIKLGDLSEKVAARDGYRDTVQLIETMKDIYVDITDDSDITIVWFTYGDE